MVEIDQVLNLESWRSLGGPIGELQAGARIDVYLAQKYPFLTRSAWQKRLQTGEVRVNFSECKTHYKLKVNDRISYYHPEDVEPEVDRNLEVLWREGAVMAVYKPGNLPMHENGPYRKNTFAALLCDLVGSDWSAVHRLDRETSGIVLCGASPSVRDHLARDFESKLIKKEYLFVANGTPVQKQWTVDGPIGDLTESQIRIKKWVVAGGLPSQTDFECEGTKTAGDQSSCLVRAYPKTGRTNQIRIHAAYSGHWILGDKLYHPNENVFLDYWEQRATTDFCVEQTRASRCCLHAAAIEFQHPEMGAPVRVESEMPADMREIWLS